MITNLFVFVLVFGVGLQMTLTFDTLFDDIPHRTFALGELRVCSDCWDLCTSPLRQVIDDLLRGLVGDVMRWVQVMVTIDS